jgi:hypothetical protein
MARRATARRLLLRRREGVVHETSRPARDPRQPRARPRHRRGARATCHLSYGSGPLIPNVKVVQIFWGTTNNPQYQYKDKLAAYDDAVANSAYCDWLREYNTINYRIGRGALAATYADPSPPAGTMISETTVLQPAVPVEATSTTRGTEVR